MSIKLALLILYIFSFFVNINGMDFYSGKKKIIDYLSYAFLLCAFSKIVLFFVFLLPFEGIQNVKGIFSNLDVLVFSALFSGFASFFALSNTKQSLVVSFVVLLSSTIFYSFSGVGYSIAFAIILSVFMSIMLDKFSSVYYSVFIIFLGVLLSILLGVLYPFAYDGLKAFCSVISGKGAIFGIVNDVYSVLVSDTFSNLFYHHDYSSAQVIEDEIVSGVVDIFSVSKYPSSLVSKYLSGKYFVNIFLSISVGVVLFSRLDDKARIVLIFVCLAGIITGNTVLLSLFLLCYNPFLYLGYLFCVFLSYFVARFVDVRIGFVDGGSVVELFKYGEKWVYFILIGIVLAVLLYFVFQLILSRFDFDKYKFVPKDARRIISALGGEQNIVRVANGKVYVANPNLIDILRLDCDIHENEITLLDDEFDILQKYL